ncbi:hypothetical protein DQ04_01571070 [Trypanosoma grayi]|uniref:hypothetical protein n=1 Tax=Trypanosoma grayi TaxID=71804 RepID=UPI0004F43056|nr:hypothetical protein DQ04_01571070 [Trypanosoma grayi]KEG12624.1 hypothetical protein DQ04_01571070 [Trypanosoma grayi]
MFAVRCEAASLWHPAVHHSLLLLRALKQRHTLVLEPSGVATARTDAFWRLSQYSSRLTISAPENSSSGDGGAPMDGSRGESSDALLHVPQDGLQRVHDPQHILYFWDLATSLQQQRQQQQKHKQLQAYLDAAVVTSQILGAVDDVLVALSSGEMETTRQTHSHLMDLVARLDTSLHGGDDGDEMVQEMEDWSTWPLFTTLQFLVEEGGLLLGPFPRMAKAYLHLRESKPVVAHTRLVDRTVALALNSEDSPAQPPTWPHRSFLREVQRQLADYTANPAERMMAGVVGEKGPLKARVSGARFGLQSVSARTPWTVQQQQLRKP